MSRFPLIALLAGLFCAPLLAAGFDISGTWEFNVETSAGSGSPSFVFTQSGEKLTGTYNGLFGKAELTGTVLFAFDLNYAGVFRLTNIPAESLGPLLMIECPRLLFPFARELIASAISNGGFPPLMLQPIDFVGLYQRRLADMQAQQATTQA